MKGLAHIFVFFCFFPYLDLMGLGTDTQPNAMLVGSALLLGIKDKKVNPPIVLLWLLFFFSLFLVFKNNHSFFIYLKNTLNYLSPALICMCTYAILTKLNYKISFKTFLTVVIIYGIVGLVQLLIYPEFMTFLLNGDGRGVMLGGRGVISLCPEPAFYGSLCLFFMIFSFLNFSKKENYILIPLLLAQQFLLGMSATAAAIFFLALLLFTVIQILRLRVGYIVFTTLALLIIVPIVNDKLAELEETRIGKLANDFIEDPLMITHLDLSVGSRYVGAVAPFLSFKHEYFLPMGIGTYKAFLRQLYRDGHHRSFLNSDIANEEERLGGSLNVVLFQLGFLGLLFPIAIVLAFKKLLYRDAIVFSLLLFFCLLFTQLQLMHSMIGFLMGVAIYKSKEQAVMLKRVSISKIN